MQQWKHIYNILCKDVYCINVTTLIKNSLSSFQNKDTSSTIQLSFEKYEQSFLSLNLVISLLTQIFIQEIDPVTFIMDTVYLWPQWDIQWRWHFTCFYMFSICCKTVSDIYVAFLRNLIHPYNTPTDLYHSDLNKHKVFDLMYEYKVHISLKTGMDTVNESFNNQE